MTEKLFVKSDDLYSDRFLHKGEQFTKGKCWNMHIPEEREFKNGECIVTDQEDTAYSIDELLNILNFLHNNYYTLLEDKKQYKILVESLKDENQKLKLILKDLGVEYYG